MKSLDKNFRHLSREDKLKQLVDYGWLDKTNYQTLLSNPVIDEEVANSLIENVIGQGTLPVGLLPKIIVDEKEYVVPMMVEEPSVVAAASYGSKLVNQTGGFKTIKSEHNVFKNKKTKLNVLQMKPILLSSIVEVVIVVLT